MLAAYIFVDIGTRPRFLCARRAEAVAQQVKFAQATYATWSGQFEYMERAAAKMIVVPVTLAIIFLLLYLNFRRITESLIVMLSVPFAPGRGIVWLLWLPRPFNVRSRSPSASSRWRASPRKPAWSC